MSRSALTVSASLTVGNPESPEDSAVVEVSVFLVAINVVRVDVFRFSSDDFVDPDIDLVNKREDLVDVPVISVRWGPKDDNCVLTPLFTFLDEFSSNSFGIHASGDMPTEIGDVCCWKITGSAVVHINGTSCVEKVKSWVSNGGDGGLWIIDEAKPGKRESESIDEVEEVIVVLL
ncbi:hypothetical protein HETIRDRAFT_430420 [Heterobasidion irregulare TC 32-1]|uniref:Uncharacterized protein n=1 Tax=Heterobasidion irregulare (strain TC 32-1) TaxID=747525 RepID=W4JS90_HETIT|nr:uncharacterized protein HETIRDRAFT_430420 [Heterobasidion irregulare TC 32-1]ETW75970.1 hypothetical protein HETIRDRAFT_430420 [Heterobasidion irregulare TC 32-1]